MDDAQNKTMIRESHIQTVGIGLMTLALAWVGATLRSMYDAQIEQREAIEAVRADMTDLRTEVKDVRAQLGNVPTQREIDARFDSMGRRIDTLERTR